MIGGGVLVTAIGRPEQVLDLLRQLSGSEPAGRAFQVLDHGEACNFVIEEGAEKLGIVGPGCRRGRTSCSRRPG